MLLACLLLGVSLTPSVGRAEPGAPSGPERKNKPLSQAQIDGLLAAQSDFRRVAGGNFYAPDPTIRPMVDAVVRQHGFASLDELHRVVDVIERVMDGIDDATGRYLGVRQIMEQRMAVIAAQADRSEADKASLLNGLRQVLASKEAAAKPSASEIALVTKDYRRLRTILGEGSY